MRKIKNLFRELSMKNVDGYVELTNYEKDYFDEIYKIHLSSFESHKDFKRHTDQHIKRVQKSKTSNCLNVHFNTGKHYIYNLNVKHMIDNNKEEFMLINELRHLLIQEIDMEIS